MEKPQQGTVHLPLLHPRAAFGRPKISGATITTDPPPTLEKKVQSVLDVDIGKLCQCIAGLARIFHINSNDNPVSKKGENEHGVLVELPKIRLEKDFTITKDESDNYKIYRSLLKIDNHLQHIIREEGGLDNLIKACIAEITKSSLDEKLNRSSRFGIIFSFLCELCGYDKNKFINLVLTRKTELDLTGFPTDGKAYYKDRVIEKLELESRKGVPCFPIDEDLYPKYELCYDIFESLKSKTDNTRTQLDEYMCLWSGSFSLTFLEESRNFNDYKIFQKLTFLEGTAWSKIIGKIYNLIAKDRPWLHDEGKKCGGNAVWAMGSCMFAIASFLANKKNFISCFLDWGYEDYSKKLSTTVMFLYEIPLLVRLMIFFEKPKKFHFIIFYYKDKPDKEEKKKIGKILRKALIDSCVDIPKFSFSLFYSGMEHPDNDNYTGDVYSPFLDIYDDNLHTECRVSYLKYI